MAYQVDKFNGTFLTSVEDGTIDTTTDLRFVGKNYAGYGEVQNENFLHLLENFANTTAPPKSVLGQIWYDSSNKKLKFYNGTQYKVAGGAEVSITAPSGLAVGEFWWDSAAKQLYTYDGTQFVLVGPEASPDLGTSSVVAQVVKDDVNNSHTILKLLSAGNCVAIINNDTAFNLNTTVNPISGFTSPNIIKKGITLASTNTAGVSQNDYLYWGTSSNALRLGGVLAADYIQKGSVVFDSEIAFKDPGFNLGDGNDLRIRVENSDEVIIENRLGNEITFRITVTEATDERDVAVLNRTGIVPGLTNVYNLGASDNKWATVYATSINSNILANDTTTAYNSITKTFTGTITGNVLGTDSTILVNATTKELGYASATLRGNLFGSLSGNVTGTASNASRLDAKAASITITPSTAEIPIRDTSGNLYANQFIGTADKADQLLVSGTYRSAATTATANTIAARDASGDIYASLFQGTATAARYADLAEKYLADQEYEVGTVVVVGGAAEVTASSYGELAVGVVSANPAFMMNKDLEGGTYIALKGRVPVKVNGAVKKGDRLVAGDQGYAQVAADRLDVFAVALESSDDAGVKLIEAVVL
jgi:hypothetical protein